MNYFDEPQDEIQAPSRSQKKREIQALQKFGEDLVNLPLSMIRKMDLPQELHEAVIFAKSLKSHGALRRQVKLIGVLLRKSDPEEIGRLIKKFQTL